jgi:hypothetical protein
MKLYVPNPQKWVDFFHNLSLGKTSLNQSGGGRRLSIIPVNESKANDDNAYSIKAVLPAEQTTAQAKSELERQDINPTSVVNMFQSSSGQQRRGIKRKRSRKKSSKTVKRRRKSSKKKQHRRRKISRKSRKTSATKRKRDIFEIN